MTLAEVLKIVKRGPHDVLESWESGGHYFFKLWVKYGDFGTLGAKHGAVPFIFAIPSDTAEVQAAVDYQQQIVAQECINYAIYGVDPGGAPLWS